MFRKDIDKIYSETVMNYIKAGYAILTVAQAGHQGEICKTFFYKPGSNVVTGVWLRREYDAFFYDGISLCIGTQSIRTENISCYDTIIWLNDFDITESRAWYNINKNDDYRGSKAWYAPKEVADITWRVYKQRAIEQYRDFTQPDKPTTDDMKKCVLSFVRRQPKCKSTRLSDIKEIRKLSPCNPFGLSYRISIGNKAIYLCAKNTVN